MIHNQILLYVYVCMCLGMEKAAMMPICPAYHEILEKLLTYVPGLLPWPRQHPKADFWD